MYLSVQYEKCHELSCGVGKDKTFRTCLDQNRKRYVCYVMKSLQQSEAINEFLDTRLKGVITVKCDIIVVIISKRETCFGLTEVNGPE